MPTTTRRNRAMYRPQLIRRRGANSASWQSPLHAYFGSQVHPLICAAVLPPVATRGDGRDVRKASVGEGERGQNKVELDEAGLCTVRYC